jgi:hypothetical protein
MMTKRLFIFLIVGTLCGCTIDASYHGSSSEIEVEVMAKTQGLAAGSSQSGIATNGTSIYYMQSTIGSDVSGAQQRTLDKSYIVYGSVQGAITSK